MCKKARFLRIGTFVTAGIIVVFVCFSAVRADEFIWIDGSDSVGILTTSVSGFLHGVDQGQDLSDSLLSLLEPQSWRLAKIQTLLEAASFSPAITYVLSDRYAWNHGGYQQASPWLDWSEYESYTLQTLQALEYYFPDIDIEYWDIWNEPDHPYFWHGSYDQLLELFSRTYNIVKSFDPAAKLVGPSVSWYRPEEPGVANVAGFLGDLDSLYGIRLEVVSWHENNSMFDTGVGPDRIPDHADNIRAELENHLGPEYRPELHINEFAGTREHLSPGFSLAYLYYIDLADVDQAMRACWNVYSGDFPPYDYWSDCWGGLDGMFMEDGQTPQVVYWVYKTYADMTRLPRLATANSESNSCALAVKNDSSETIQILAGRYWDQTSENITVDIQHYPYEHDSVLVRQWRIPHYPGFFEDRPHAIALPDGPLVWMTQRMEIVNSSLSFVIENFGANEVFYTTIDEISPQTEIADGSGTPVFELSTENYPNPFNSQTVIRYSLPAQSEITIDIFDILGRKIETVRASVEMAGEHTFIWNAGEKLSGIYFYRISAGGYMTIGKMILLR
jgi:hypothetical protein